MKLKQITVEGYRSFRTRISVIVEPDVTVVLGPNDHGKTNLLGALVHLNADNPFDEDRDLNWDSSEKRDFLPAVLGTFALSDAERERLVAMENSARAHVNVALEKRATGEGAGSADADDELGVDAGETEEGDDSESDGDYGEVVERELPADPLSEISIAAVPTEIVASRIGVEGELVLKGLEAFQPETLSSLSNELMPRFELIGAATALSDSVTAEELAPGENEFMRGIFYYAGLDPSTASKHFEQNDRSQMALAKASEKLNHTLRESWSQGSQLGFQLTHHSKSSRIELQIQDPSVETRFVRASRRSSGFTHYFSLKTMLHARQKDHPAHSYVFLFDEPGVFLHPSGQYDLLQVLETLATENQIVYVTHSLFMINKTFPTRHRLVMKNEQGTTVDGKPYVGRWQAALGSLGLTLTGSILFANHVVIVEGDSDPIYLYSVLRKAIAAGHYDLDLNSLSIMPTSDPEYAELLIRLLCDTSPRPQIMVLVDGDEGGAARLSYLKKLLDTEQIPVHQFSKGTTLEDHLPVQKDAYLPALAGYAVKVHGAADPTLDESKLSEQLRARYEDQFKDRVTQGLADWSQAQIRELASVASDLSKVNIARDYAVRVEAMPTEEFKLGQRSKTLIDALREKTRLHGSRLTAGEIVSRGK